MKYIKVLDIDKLNSIQILTSMYKYNNNTLPYAFTNILKPVYSEKYNLRSNRRNNFNYVRVKSMYSLHSLLYKGPYLWNCLPIEHKNLKSTKGFKYTMKKSLVGTY